MFLASLLMVWLSGKYRRANIALGLEVVALEEANRQKAAQQEENKTSKVDLVDLGAVTDAVEDGNGKAIIHD